MAYKKTVQGRSYPFLYNVTMTVGSRKSAQQKTNWEWVATDVPGGWQASQPVTHTIYTASFEPNKRDDVMLVQYLLKRVYQQGQKVQPPLSQNTGAAQLKIDGLYGSKTARAIEQFQLEMRRNGRSIATDGCVDPELGDSTTSSISKTGYTISWLNKYFWLLYPYLAPDISIDPECPPELKQAVGNGGFYKE
jgi:peptidoglycan hydrolase-like protein with peptidoglycan-binding domain